jgi:hypothetical protein
VNRDEPKFLFLCDFNVGDDDDAELDDESRDLHSGSRSSASAGDGFAAFCVSRCAPR